MPPRRSSEPEETTCLRCGKRLVRLVLWVDPTTYFRPSYLLSSLDQVQTQQSCLHEPSDTEIGELGLQTRTYMCLLRYGITTIGQVFRMTDTQLLGVRNLGPKSLRELRTAIQAHQSRLRESPNSAQAVSAESEERP